MRNKIQLLAGLLLIFNFLSSIGIADDCTYNCTPEEKALTVNIMRDLDTGQTISNREQIDRQKWTTADTIVEAATYVVMYMDYKQTTEIAKNHSPGRHYSERNPFLPRHPTIGEVNSVFILSALAHPVISYALPQPLRKIWQYSYIAIEGYCVYANYRIGLDF